MSSAMSSNEGPLHARCTGRVRICPNIERYRRMLRTHLTAHRKRVHRTAAVGRETSPEGTPPQSQVRQELPSKRTQGPTWGSRPPHAADERSSYSSLPSLLKTAPAEYYHALPGECSSQVNSWASFFTATSTRAMRTQTAPRVKPSRIFRSRT
jgi:hypothetical protein